MEGEAERTSTVIKIIVQMLGEEGELTVKYKSIIICD